MAGNSKRQGAIRDASAKKPRTVGSGGNRRQGLEPKGPTPKASERTGHVAGRRAASAERAAERSAPQRGGGQRGRRGKGDSEVVAGRNQVLEAMLAGVPSLSLSVQRRIDNDPRVKQAMLAAAAAGLSIQECSRDELEALTDGVVHQGIVLSIAPYEYSELDDLLLPGTDARPSLVVALDGITDTRNLGAIARSTAAFGGTGLVIPSRRSATVTAAAWRTSAGALTQLKVAMVTNMSRSIEAAKEAGFTVVGLAGEAETDIGSLDLGNDPVMLVVGSEGKGLGRLVAQSCDFLVSIPLSGKVESLNAGVAAGIALYGVSSARRKAQ